MYTEHMLGQCLGVSTFFFCSFFSLLFILFFSSLFSTFFFCSFLFFLHSFSFHSSFHSLLSLSVSFYPLLTSVAHSPRACSAAPPFPPSCKTAATGARLRSTSI
jgi:hypothetical protein